MIGQLIRNPYNRRFKGGILCVGAGWFTFAYASVRHRIGHAVKIDFSIKSFATLVTRPRTSWRDRFCLFCLFFFFFFALLPTNLTIF